ELAGGGGHQGGEEDERGDPEADHGAAPVVAPGGKVAHGADASGTPALGHRCWPNPDRGVVRSDLADTGLSEPEASRARAGRARRATSARRSRSDRRPAPRRRGGTTAARPRAVRPAPRRGRRTGSPRT